MLFSNIVRRFATRLTKVENKRLDMAEMPNNIPRPLFNRFLKTLKQEDFICYPCEKDYDNLKNSIATLNDVAPSNISLNHGSDQSIKNIFNLFQSKGSEVIFNTPSFPMYQVYADTFGFTPRLVGYNDYQCELEDLLALVNKNTKLLVLANPNSPYGDIKSKDEIADLCDRLQQRGVYLLLDEAYIDFGGESCSSLIYRFDNLFITKTFSKAWGAAGTRCGYSISSPLNTNILEKIRPSFPYAGPTIKYLQFILDNPCIKNNFVKTVNEEKAAIKKLSLKNISTHSGAVSWVNCTSNDSFLMRKILDEESIAYKYIDNKYIRIGLFKGFSKLIKKIDLQL
jgi:histidinol-phosphate aminotransferase